MSEPLADTATSYGMKEVRGFLCARFRKALGQPDFAVDEGFLDAGGDSLTAVETILEIEAEYGVTLSTAEFMALDTAENLARHIALEMEKQRSTSSEAQAKGCTLLSEVQAGDRSTVLICSYDQKGSAPYSITLAGLLPKDQSVAAAQVRADVVADHGLMTFADTAKSDADNILQQYPDHRHALLGFSLGSHVALSVGHELTRRNSPPLFIAVMDDEADLGRRNFGSIMRQSDAAALPIQIKAALDRSSAEPISARMVYFRSAENEAYYRSDPSSGWGEIAAGGVVFADVPAGHINVANENGLRVIAPRLLEEMSKPFEAAPDPSDAQMVRFQARRAAREGCLTTELELLNQAIEIDGEQPSWVFANLAEAYFQKGDSSSALGALANARQQENWQLTLDMRFANKMQAYGAKDEVEGILNRLAALSADHPSVHEQKALTYYRMGMSEDCERELKLGFSMQADHMRLSRLHLRYLQQKQAWAEMREVAERLIEVFPGVSPFRTSLIRAYLKTGAPEKALRFRDDFAADGRFDYKGLIGFGGALLECGHNEEALRISEHSIDVAPAQHAAHFLRAKCLHSLGRATEATQARRHARSLRDKQVSR